MPCPSHTEENTRPFSGSWQSCRNTGYFTMKSCYTSSQTHVEEQTGRRHIPEGNALQQISVLLKLLFNIFAIVIHI
jgi:hypothetical protein